MFLRTLCLIALMAPEGIDASTSGGSVVTPPEPQQPFATFPTSEALEKRLKQSNRAQLRELFGTEDLDLIRARQAKLTELETQEEERRKAQLTTEERLKAEKAEAEQKAREAVEALAQEKLERKIAQECASRGCKNTSYASYLIYEQTSKLADGDQLDIGTFLDATLKSEQHRTALGITAPVSQVADPATTIPAPVVGAPPPPPPGATQPAVDAMSMSDDEWRKHKQSLGI